MTNAEHGSESESREKRGCMQMHVREWMEKAGQPVIGYNKRQAGFQMGMQLEEMAEKLATVAGGCITRANTERLASISKMLDELATDFKIGGYDYDMMRADHAQMIDADFDLAWVSIGSVLSIALHPLDAIAHGTWTNFDKYRNGVIRDARTGKVLKPADWRNPDWTPYLDNSIRENDTTVRADLR